MRRFQYAPEQLCKGWWRMQGETLKCTDPATHFRCLDFEPGQICMATLS